MTTVRVLIQSKAGVLDPEGEAVKGGIERLGHEGVERVGVGKVVDIDFETDDTDGTVYEQSGNGFDGTDRTNSVPCPDCCELKYEGPDFDSPESKRCSP